MNAKQLLIGTLVIGVVANILDSLFWGMLMRPVLTTISGMNNDPGLVKWYIIGDFVFAFMICWYYGIVRNSFSSATKFGMLTGIFVAFPMDLIFGMMINGHPYWMSWVTVVFTIVSFTIIGMVLGKVAGSGSKA